MSSVVATAPIAPVLREPAIRAEQVTQLLLGRLALVLEDRGDWRRVHCALDGYEGWLHTGYTRLLDDAAAEAWAAAADGWSEGAVVEVGERLVRLPLGGRVRIGRNGIELPDGAMGHLIAGRVAAATVIGVGARAMPVDKWLLRFFGGAPYQWGGLTPWGVDCSGLMQTAFAARGLALPRDSFLQAEIGDEIALQDVRRGDLLFFSENGRAVTHVALLGAEGKLVHSTLSCGGFVVEPWGPGTRAAFLRDIFVIARRPVVPVRPAW
ncbi:MAG: NlpC/P60 family protein [Gemmatimonadales bacterium]